VPTDTIQASTPANILITDISKNLRLIVINIIADEDQIPRDIIPDYNPSDRERFDNSKAGRKVLGSTPNLYLRPLLDCIRPSDGPRLYDLVSCWKAPRLNDSLKKRLDVRFVFCHKDHVRTDKLFPNFVANQERFLEALSSLIGNYLWRTEAHINPYRLPGGELSGDEVAMIDCVNYRSVYDRTGGMATTYAGGKDEFGQGLGRLVPIIDVAKRIEVADKQIILR